jgi:hypothetical protein
MWNTGVDKVRDAKMRWRVPDNLDWDIAVMDSRFAGLRPGAVCS